jgi:hypothetical protein
MYDAAFWLLMESDPITHKYKCDHDHDYSIYYSEHPNGEYAVYDKSKEIISAIRAGFIKVTNEQIENDSYNINKTYISMSDWIRWCKEQNYPDPKKLFLKDNSSFAESKQTAPEPELPIKGNDVKGVSYGFSSDNDWKEKARKIAERLFDNDTKGNCRDCLIRKNHAGGYAVRVMDEMQRLEIHGPRGRICNPATIAREALQGKRWWGKKQK